jgi:hypothetical protein
MENDMLAGLPPSPLPYAIHLCFFPVLKDENPIRGLKSQDISEIHYESQEVVDSQESPEEE